MTNPIGQIKTSITVYCEICGESRKRKLSSYVYENTPEEIEKIKSDIKVRAAKKYTCNICKSILRQV